MAWLTSLRHQLPLLLVLSPLVGFVVAGAAARKVPDLTRHFAVSNLLCTLVILLGVIWQFESERIAEVATLQAAGDSQSVAGMEVGTPDEVRRMLDRMRTERIRQSRFVADGVNLFPALLLTVMTTLIVFRFNPSQMKGHSFIPLILLFQAAALGTLLANDVMVFMMSSALSVVCLSFLIGQYGSAERRVIAERFLWAQCWGGAFILLGSAMLVVSVPWMKIQDAIGTPTVSTNIADLIQDIQKWTTRNELAFHYQSEIFPGLLLILSLGFAILSGIFPFHGSQIDVVKDAPAEIAILYVTGGLAANRIGWFRFVMPLSPDLLASFDEWVLFSALGGALWGALRASGAAETRQQSAYLFMSITGISLMGCYTFTRIGMCGTWLMQQQLNVLMCTALLTFGMRATDHEAGFNSRHSAGPAFTTRTLLLLLSLPLLCFFASGFLIVSELIRESLLLVSIMSIAGTLIVFKTSSNLNERYAIEQRDSQVIRPPATIPRPVLLGFGLAFAVACLPSLLLRQCEPEFARVFRRFEQSQAAVRADTGYVQRQSAP